MCAAGDSWAIGTDNAGLVGRVDLLCSLRRALGTLAALATTLLLGEQSGDPGLVDEVAGSGEDTGEDEVEEDAVRLYQYGLFKREGTDDCSHLRVKERGGSLDNGDGLVEHLLGEHGTLGVLDDGGQVEGQVLGVHLGCEAVGKRLLLAGRDGDIVAGGRQVADNDWWLRSAWNANWSHEGATNKEKVDGLSLEVCD